MGVSGSPIGVTHSLLGGVCTYKGSSEVYFGPEAWQVESSVLFQFEAKFLLCQIQVESLGWCLGLPWVSHIFSRWVEFYIRVPVTCTWCMVAWGPPGVCRYPQDPWHGQECLNIAQT